MIASVVIFFFVVVVLHQVSALWCLQHSPPPSAALVGSRFRRSGGGATSCSASSGDGAAATDADASLHRTLRRLGVRGIASPSSSNPRGGVGVRTTPKSVAGRGAFWLSPSASNAQRGDVLAYVPKTSVLTLSNPALLSSRDGDDGEEAHSSLSELASLPSECSWPAAFTLYVAIVAQRNEPFREWIDSFIGPDPPVRPPGKEDDLDKDDGEPSQYDQAVQNVVSIAQVSLETAREATAARYEAYARDWSAAQEWINDKDRPARITIDEPQFAKLHSILVSRTANLGPVYSKSSADGTAVRGVIPLHDMVNHPPRDVEHNVELFTVGDLREFLPEEMVQNLVGEAAQADNSDACIQLDDRDVLLVARREIVPGEELFLSYRNNRMKPMEEKESAWTTLQYGFLIE